MSPRPIFGGITMRPRHQSGWIEERGTKRRYWYGHYRVSVKNENGEDQREKTGTFLGYKSEMTKSQARDKLQGLIFKATKEGVAPTDKVTLSWFWENRFLPMREGRWELSTRSAVRCDWDNYIKPKLENIPLRRFDKFSLQTHLNDLAAANYSEWVVKRTKTLLSSIFIEAVDLQFLASNPMAKVKLPRYKPTPKPVLPIEDARRLYAALPFLRDRLIFRLGVFLGPRASELFGFTVDCWMGDVLEIRQTAYKGVLRKAKVKTDGSRRSVPVPPDMRAMLRRYIEESGLSGEDLLFPGRDGKHPLWPGTWLQKHLQSVAKQIGVTVPVTFQVLRRSFVTRHRNELKDAGAVVGHANYATTTANVYAQSVEASVIAMLEEDERRIGLMEQQIGGVQ
jgi:integrase